MSGCKLQLNHQFGMPQRNDGQLLSRGERSLESSKLVFFTRNTSFKPRVTRARRTSLPIFPAFQTSKAIVSATLQSSLVLGWKERARKHWSPDAAIQDMNIAQDFYEKGYDVTMIQRSSTCVISSKAILDIGLAGLFDVHQSKTPT
jgi:hypothetical protein